MTAKLSDATHIGLLVIEVNPRPLPNKVNHYEGVIIIWAASTRNVFGLHQILMNKLNERYNE